MRYLLQVSPTSLEAKDCRGIVGEVGGEFAATKFSRLGPLPIFPRKTYWCTPDLESKTERYLAMPMRMQWRSVLAGMLRVWGPILAVLFILPDNSIEYAIAAALVGASAWTWTWRHATKAQRQRSDFALVAIGSRCEPAKMSAQWRDAITHNVRNGRLSIQTEHSADDVARFGASESELLIAAYAELVIAKGERRSIEKSLARIRSGNHERSTQHEGVFRTGHRKILGAGELAAVVAKEAESIALANERHSLTAPRQGIRQALEKRWFIAVGGLALVGLATAGIGGLVTAQPKSALPVKDLRSLATRAELKKVRVQVKCDAVTAYRRIDAVVHMCELGGKLLPVVSNGDLAVTDNTVAGWLEPRVPVSPRRGWERRLQADERTDVRTLQYFLNTDLRSYFGQIALGLTLIVANVLLLVLWVRNLRRRGRRRKELAAQENT